MKNVRKNTRTAIPRLCIYPDTADMIKTTATAGILLSPIGILPAAESPPNILVILLDDAGWRDVGYAGNSFIETPNIDRLAAEGMQFNLAYSSHPFSAPSRQSMITGQWPARTAWLQRNEAANPDAPRDAKPFIPYGAPPWTKRRPEFTSLAEALKTGGYTTGHIGKWHFGIPKQAGIIPENEGFDFSFGGDNITGAVLNHFAPFEGLPGNVSSTPGEYLTDRLTEETIQFIRQNKDKPFYVQLWHYAPHTPIMAPEEVVEKYRKKRQQMKDDSLNPTYAAMIDVVDQGVGRIRAELEKLGLDDRTVIIFTSDNGAQIALGSIPVTSVAPFRGEKLMVYQGGVREPLIIHWPGVTKAGMVSDEMVCNIDFYPTILNIAGVPFPDSQPVDGKSLVPLLKTGVQPELKDRSLFWYNVNGEARYDGDRIFPVASVRKGSWRLVKNFGRPIELYDMENDISEQVNLAEQNPDCVSVLEQELNDWLADTGIVTPTVNPSYNPDYIVPHQIAAEEIPSGAQVVREWKFSNNMGKWSNARMVKTEVKNGILRMQSDGLYPEILTSDLSGLPSGVYIIQLELNIATSGRIRFAWKDQGGAGENIEFFPRRDGTWHTLSAIFQSTDSPVSFRFAAPTNLRFTGLYDPKTQPDYIEVKAIRLLSVSSDSAVVAESKPAASSTKTIVFFDDFNRSDVAGTVTGERIGAGYTAASSDNRAFAIKRGKVIPAGAGKDNVLYHSKIKTENSGDRMFTLSVDITPQSDQFKPNLGLAFNVQNDGDFYALRIGSDDLSWQFLRRKYGAAPSGKTGAFGAGDFGKLERGVEYTLTVSSSRPYAFEFELRKKSNGALIGSGKAVDDLRLYQDGLGGIYFSNSVGGSQFDNLKILR